MYPKYTLQSTYVVLLKIFYQFLQQNKILTIMISGKYTETK